ncbi:MAG TPA: ABC transporter permease [Gaiellaceae bacterium]|nr:ABC transporter permease [Gaiellaceae bacterium]
MLERTAVAQRAETIEADDELPAISDRVTVIRPASGLLRIDLRELWQYRELAATFAWRDLKVRYKQSLIGAAWAILQPVMTMVVFTFVFGTFAHVPSQGLPYPVFSYSGLLPWVYFAAALGAASSSLQMNSSLVTKIYFPRVLLPLAAVTVPAVDFLLACTVLGGFIGYYHLSVGVHALLAPVFMILAAASALGVGLVFAVINVRYRDVPYAIPFVIQIWMFLSPVIYPTNALHHAWERLILSLNPMNGVITGFRWSLLGTTPPSTLQVLLSVAAAAVFLLVGLAVFRRAEPRFADTI